jgi:hypothetical protein
LLNVVSSFSSLFTKYQEEQIKHQGDEAHINEDKFPLVSWRFICSIILSANDNLHKLVKCCLQFLTIKNSLVCHVPIPKETFLSPE